MDKVGDLISQMKSGNKKAMAELRAMAITNPADVAAHIAELAETLSKPGDDFERRVCAVAVIGRLAAYDPKYLRALPMAMVDSYPQVRYEAAKVMTWYLSRATFDESGDAQTVESAAA